MILLMVLRRYHDIILRQKVISEAGSQQLLLDTYNLKTLMLHLHSLGTTTSSTPNVAKAPVVYSKFVIGKASQIETVLKLVGTPTDVLIERFLIMWTDGKMEDLYAVMTLKGIKKQDQQVLIEAQSKQLAQLMSSGGVAASGGIGISNSASNINSSPQQFSASILSTQNYLLDPVAGGAVVAGSAVASASMAMASSVRSITQDISTSALTGLTAVGNMKWGNK
ncbi:unnamed protein product [Sphagnum jensenii]|uniref:Vps53 C-terminal domain-containing protein n=1 Tax=Sphagnum jensenii TaxID=128206 RepID=A0ABP0VF33_9BRYO